LTKIEEQPNLPSTEGGIVSIILNDYYFLLGLLGVNLLRTLRYVNYVTLVTLR